MIEYADLECPFCARAHLVLKRLAVTRVFRHFPVTSKHPRARVLAAAAEAAGRQGRFWEMHDSLLEDQGHLDDPHLWERAERLGLDLERFEADRRSEEAAARVEGDFRSGIRAGVSHDAHAVRGRGGPPGGAVGGAGGSAGLTPRC